MSARGPSPRRCRRTAAGGVQQLRRPLDPQRRPCPSPRRSTAAPPAAPGRRAPSARSRPCARTGRGSGRRVGVRADVEEHERSAVAHHLDGQRRAVDARQPPDRSTAAAMAAPVWPAVTTASARPTLTRSQATMIEESFFSRNARAGCSSISMTWLAGTISTFGGRSPPMSRDPRAVTDKEDVVLGMRPGRDRARRERPRRARGRHPSRRPRGVSRVIREKRPRASLGALRGPRRRPASHRSEDYGVEGASSFGALISRDRPAGVVAAVQARPMAGASAHGSGGHSTSCGSEERLVSTSIALPSVGDPALGHAHESLLLLSMPGPAGGSSRACVSARMV